MKTTECTSTEWTDIGGGGGTITVTHDGREYAVDCHFDSDDYDFLEPQLDGDDANWDHWPEAVWAALHQAGREMVAQYDPAH